MEKKRGQHYVWRYYLTSWTDDSEKLSCLRNNNLFPANPKKIAKARDFYRLRDLSQDEIAIIEQGFINGYHTEEIQKINREWINVFTSIFRDKKVLEQKGEWDDKKEAELDVHMNNLVEDFHSRIEDLALPYLDSLKNSNLDFLDSEISKFDFMFFLCLQYFRTNMMKNNILKSFESGSVPIPSTFIENVWSVLYFIFATNLAVTLSSSNSFRFLMLKNNSTIPFITGDQPVINTHANYSVYEETKEFELYYPLTPSLALLITDSNNYNENQSIFEVQENEVTLYNNLIFNASYEQIFANNETVLKSFKK
ncbi:DUF4238 domain-containing protein [Bacillus sp. FSL W8-0519]|uniref:DUF4238 domain-containing protein n=1 Tax=Bacillus cereus TaxID=1396 RepID=A0A150AU96_BACCE|nr:MULTISPECIES: DUF4238 domain-containing protein [Bacillus]EJR53758.1 hypothetical protein IIK_00024 [Bacillus cereus VD102]OUA67671.1 hypothetical protein BK786_10110 [Bacillus thuringiensis serovar thailandensis]HDX9541396.1 DUF4238 domain-containing protein [Bacillus thuringiensis]KLA12073.1 hypothetical protein B4087_4544 [Bacillus cereus]KMP61065.1 hypothetical protein TU57_14070 [Bacillus cereus]